MNLLTNAAYGSFGDAGVRMLGDLAGSYIPKAGTALYDQMLKNGELIRRLSPAAEPLANALLQDARRLAQETEQRYTQAGRQGAGEVLADGTAAAREAIEGAGDFIDGMKIADGKVGGKIPVDEFKTIRQSSIKNPDADSITLGKYTNGLDSYIAKVEIIRHILIWGANGIPSGKSITLSMMRCLNILISQL